MNRIAIILIFLLLHVKPLLGQNLVDDLHAVTSILDTAKSVRIQVTCKVYSKKDGELLNTVQTGMTKKGKMTLSSLDNIAIFDNEKYSVYVNHEEKSIKVISKAKYASRIQSVDDKSIKQFADWIKKNQKKPSFNPRLVSEKDHVRTYSITDMESVKELVVEIDVKNNLLKKITYEFSEDPQQKPHYIVLNYSGFLMNSNEIELDPQDFYIHQSGKFLPGHNYKTYSISTDL